MLNVSAVPVARGGSLVVARDAENFQHESLSWMERFLRAVNQGSARGKPVRTSKSCTAILCVCLYFSFGLSRSFAQKLSSAQEAELKFLLKVESRLSPQARQMLSQPVRNAIALAHQLFDPPDLAGGDDDQGELNLGLHRNSGASVRASAFALNPTLSGAPARRATDLLTQEVQGGLTQISHPEVGLQLSRLSGFTDMESSSARCGENIVTAYFSETAATFSSLIPVLADPNVITAASQVGVSFSADGGDTFTELPFLNAGPATDVSQPAGTTGTLFSVLGNPVAACSSSQRFYVADSPFFVSDLTSLGPFIFSEQLFSGVGINTSSDGGQSWADPIPAVLKNQNHFIDSGWLTVDPNNPNRLYVSYIDLDFEADFPLIPLTAPPRCPAISVRVASELVTSSDGGRTWSLPNIIREDCLPIQNGNPQGFQVASTRLAIGADGKVSAGFVLFHPLVGPDGVTVVDYKIEVHVRQSSNHGASFGPDVKVSDLVQIGDGSHSFRPALQGFFAVPTIPVLAEDSAKHGKKQNLYMAWADGRDNQQPDGAAFFGTYNFGDIVLSRSTDGGLTWSPPRAVSPTPRNFKGLGRDQFIPSIAVDHNGTIAVCYYDRRNDPKNNAFDRYCSISQDEGHTFHDVRQSPKSWMFAENWDRLGFWLGDYDTVVAPSFGDGDGFFGAFGLSGDDVTGIFGRSIRREE